jgi:hypothetical protein
MSFVFWVIVHSDADGAFKGLSTVTDVLAVRPPKGRESYTLEWNENMKDLPFSRMVTREGPQQNKALSFSSMRHNFASLAQREFFKDRQVPGWTPHCTVVLSPGGILCLAGVLCPGGTYRAARDETDVLKRWD